MALVTLNQAKLHLRVDGSDDDALITALIDTASEQISEYLNRQVFDDEIAMQSAIEGGTSGPRPPMVVNSSVQSAALLMIGYLYNSREDEPAQLPAVSRMLLDPYRAGQGV